MNIWLISIFENTPIDDVFSSRFISIAQQALKRGHNVKFFSSTFHHKKRAQRFKKRTQIQYRDHYELIFVKSIAYKKAVSVGRLWSHYRFSKKIIKELNRHPRPDVILLAFPPINLAFEVGRWAKLHKVPLIMDVIDPSPDDFDKAIPERINFMKNFLLAPFRYRLKKTLPNLSGLTALSNQYIKWANKYYHKIPRSACLYPAADMDMIQGHLSKWQEEVKKDYSNFAVIYAGSLASYYDIPCILNAAEILADRNPNIKFKIAGTGFQKNLIESYCSKYNNLTYYGRLPREKLMKEYYLSDVGTIQHIEGATQSVTYKLFDLLSAGLPILNSLESETKDLIIDNKVGLHNAPGDADTLAKNIEFLYENRDILEKYKQNGLELAKKKGDTKQVYPRFVDFMESFSGYS
jgi:glycosyltransferase involved in cell wall biosynthesis